MSTIAENLLALQQAKNDIKSAIESKGQDLTDVPFTEYGNKIISISAGGGKEIELELPSEFETATTFYWVAPTNDKLLFSSGSTTTGLWVYTISTKTWVKASDAEGTYSTFQQVTDTKWLITRYSSSGGGIHVYDVTTDTVTLVYNNAFGSKLIPFKSKCIIGATGINRGLLVYNAEDDSVKKIYDNGYDWNTQIPANDDIVFLGGRAFVVYDYRTDIVIELHTTRAFSYKIQVAENKFLFSTSGSDPSGLWLCNLTDESFTQISETGYAFQYAMNVGTKWLIASSVTSSPGVYKYDSSDDSVQQIYSTGCRWGRYGNVVGNKVLLSNSDSNNGLLRYDADTNICELIKTDGTSWEFHQNLGNKCLVCSSTGNFGIWLYNADTDVLTQLYDKGYRWSAFKVFGTKCVIGSGTSGTNQTGIFLYNSVDDSFVQLYDKGSFWNIFMDVGGKCLIGSSYYSSGMVVYNPENDTAIGLSANGYKWLPPYNVTDTKIIFSGTGNSNQGVWLFDASTDTLSRLTTVGSNYDTFVKDVDNNCWVSGTNKTRAFGTFYFTEVTNTLTLKKYYLGEI